MSTSHPSDSKLSQLPEGFRLGPYTLMHTLGSGGMADVYFGMHTELRRAAAVKVLRPSLAADQANLQRFLQEARAAASLVHPNIVQVYEFGQQEPNVDGDARLLPDKTLRFIAQEYVAGINLRQYLEQSGKLSIREALSILLQTLAALKKSSSAGIVHRDIKPENILLTSDGDVKVTDFGLARLLDDDPQLTHAGTTLGTPMYMSPEQMQNGQVDVRSDLYSLGVTLFHMLTGKPPFSGETPLALAIQHAQAQPPALSQLRQDAPQPLGQLIDRLLAKKPEDRFSSPDDVLAALKAGRNDGLAQHWPEQTIPLPRVLASQLTAAPLPATLRLQEQLNRLRRRPRHKWIQMAFMLLTVGIALAGGSLLAQLGPRSTMFGNSRNMYFGVPRQETVQAQYLYALLNAKPRNRYLWESVPYFFPPQANRTNRLYAGKAALQLARQLRQQSDQEKSEAEDVLLRDIIDKDDMDDLVKSLAWLELAVIARKRGDESKVDEALNRAEALRPTPGTEDDLIFLGSVPERFREQFSSSSVRG